MAQRRRCEGDHRGDLLRTTPPFHASPHPSTPSSGHLGEMKSYASSAVDAPLRATTS